MTSRQFTTLGVKTSTETDDSLGNTVKLAAGAIIDYILEHPGARDTARGIAEWWIHKSLLATRAAIEFLHEKGMIIKAKRNGQILFSRNPSVKNNDLHAMKTSMS